MSEEFNLLESIQQDLDRIIQSGNFTEITDAVKDDDTVIGELTDFEKAVNELRAEHTKSAQELGAGMCPCGGLCAVAEEDKAEAMFHVKSANVIRDIFWLNVIKRLAALGTPHLAIRAGFKVVSIPETEDEDDGSDFDPLGLFSALGGRVRVGVVNLGSRPQENEPETSEETGPTEPTAQ